MSASELTPHWLAEKRVEKRAAHCSTQSPVRLSAEDAWDRIFLLLAVLHGAVVIAAPVIPTIALGVWWNSNTIGHHLVHRPLVRRPTLNVALSLYLSVLLGIPQSVWRQRHLAHHAGAAWKMQPTKLMLAEMLLIGSLWISLAVVDPAFLLKTYAPGLAFGLALCALHGYFEHRNGAISHYGRLYNWLFFNDGYHVEHHACPGRHWRRLPQHVQADAQASRWPAVLRWFDAVSLDSLERLVLWSPWLQRFVVARHQRAFSKLLAGRNSIRRVAIVGGGLFPRSVLVLRRILPHAAIVVIDANAAHLKRARRFLDNDIEITQAWYDPERHRGFDLVVIPLAYIGDRAALYARPPAPTVLIHDWLWRRRGVSAIVSLLLLKRLNRIGSRTWSSHESS